MDINFPMASSSSFSVLCINHTKVSVSEASCCGPPTFPNSSLLSSSYAVHRFTKWTSSSTSSKSHILHFLSLLSTAGRAYLPVSIARLCALVLSCARFVASSLTSRPSGACALGFHKSQSFAFTTQILVRYHHLKSPHFLHKTYCSDGCCVVVDLLSWRQLVLLGLKLHKRKGSIDG